MFARGSRLSADKIMADFLGIVYKTVGLLGFILTPLLQNFTGLLNTIDCSVYTYVLSKFLQNAYHFAYTLCLKKLCHHTFAHNSGKCWPTFKILSLFYFPRNLQQKSCQHVPPHLKCVTAVPCEVKI